MLFDIDKLFAAEAYVRSASTAGRAFEAAKHIYDLAAMHNHPKIRQVLKDPTQMEHLLKIRMDEELRRLDGIPNILPAEFILFTQAGDSVAVGKAYDTMQKQYVFRTYDRIEFTAAVTALQEIQKKLLQNPSWINCRLHIET